MNGSLLGDIRYALRGLAARPLFTLVAVASLALGIGVNTAIFSLFQQVVLQPLPVQAPERLVNLSAPGIKNGSTSNNQAGRRDDIFSYPMFRDLQQQLPAEFAGIAAHRYLTANIGARDLGASTRGGAVMLVSGNYFDLLGVAPAAGRLLAPHDDATVGAGRVAVLSHAYWQNRLAGRPDAVGGSVVVNGQALTIVGVAPPDFRGTTFGVRPEVFAPISSRWLVDPRAQDDSARRNSYWVYLFGRLAEGATPEQAAQAINRPYAAIINDIEVPLHPEIPQDRMDEFRAQQIVLSPGRRGQSTSAENAATPLRLLMGVSLLVLVIACLNIANLLLARGASRAGEFALRVSIGASRRRLMRQAMVEASLLAVGGAVASLPLAALVSAGLVAWMPDNVGDSFRLGLDGGSVLFTAAVALATVLLFGVFPALQLARIAPVTVLRGEGGQTASRGGNRFRAALATVQVALCMVSLVLAGLFTQSLMNIAREDLGMQVESLGMLTIAPERNGYTPERAAALFDRLEQELAAVPGVTHVASSLVPLLTDNSWGSNVSVEGHESSPDEESPFYNQVGTGFFEAFGIPLLAGRDFTLADNQGAAKVAIVNQAFAEHFGLAPNPVGKRMSVGSSEQLDIEIIGLVADSKYNDVKQAVRPVFTLPRRQGEQPPELNFYVRSAVPAETLLAQLPQVVARLDPDLPVENVSTVPQQIAETVVMERFVGLLSGGFAVLATLLAALGLYGVLSFTLAQRMREIGLRLALGAQPRRVAAMVLRQVGRMTVVGGVLGLLAALAIGRAAEALLFGLQGHDPAVLSAAALVLALVALAAAALPARRATRTDPMTALRHD